MRLKFEDIWDISKNKTIQNKVPIKVSGISAERYAIKAEKGACFGGVDWSLFIGRDIQVETDKEFFVITGIY